MNLQNFQPPHLIRQGNLDLAIQPACAQQGRIQGVGPIGGHDDLSLAEVVEAVELVEQFHQGALDLAVGGGALAEAAAANRVDLVHEDDAWFMLFGVAEHFADQACGFADVLVNNGGGDDWDRIR